MKKNKLSQIWFQKGKEDLLYAKAVLNEVKIYGLLCFHCQQAVEKFLKGYLTEKGIKFRKTHKLAELLLLCIKGNKEFDQFKPVILILDKYYIEPRYPLDQPKDYTKNEAKEALNIAQKILDFINNK